jgi:hypothetical protein
MSPDVRAQPSRKLHRRTALDQEARFVVGMNRFEGAGESQRRARRAQCRARVRNTREALGRPLAPGVWGRRGSE